MFQNIDLNLNAGPIKNAWMRLIRQIQTSVEHNRVTNVSGAAMVKGDIIYMTATGDRQADLALADDPATVRWAAVMAEPTAAGERGIARTDGYALVRFVTGLGAIGDSNEGQQVYLDDTVAGAANVGAPQGNFTAVIGILADATEYSDDNPFAWVLLGHCCIPSENEQ